MNLAEHVHHHKMLLLRCPKYLSYKISPSFLPISPVGSLAVSLGEILSFSYSAVLFLRYSFDE